MGENTIKDIMLGQRALEQTPTIKSAYYHGAWVTCIFELTKISDFSIVTKNYFQTASI